MADRQKILDALEQLASDLGVYFKSPVAQDLILNELADEVESHFSRGAANDVEEFVHRDWVVDGPVRVCFDYIGEGHEGDYDPDDPDDQPLLRLDMQVSAASNYGGEDTDDPAWVYPQDGSICTLVSLHSSEEDQHRYLVTAAQRLRTTVEANESVKHLMDRLSWLPAELA